MRELKFRAYYAPGMAEGVMFYSDDSAEYHNDGDALSTWLTNSVAFGPNSVHIMQYTGLKDRNGKEIYVGDILKLDLISGDRFSKVHVCPLLEVPTVCFFEDEGWVPLFQFVGKPDTCLQVAGNIHESPELLEG